MTFVFYQRLPPGRATLWSILGAYLLLPVGTSLDLPMVPPLDKSSVPNLSAYLVCVLIKGKRVPFLPRLPLARWLMLIYIISPFLTALNNEDPIAFGPVHIKGMESYDALSAVTRQLLFILPFMLGTALLRNAQDHEALLRVLVAAALFYSLPMLFEVRMSPQLHRWIYGYFPHSFVQQMREGGFRPVVFMGHGLLVAFFTMTGVVAATAFWRIRARVKQFSGGMMTAYLIVILLLCKSMGSMFYALVLLPLVRYGRPRQQIRVAGLMVIVALMYPLIRGWELFPSQMIHDFAASFSDERAASFDFRIANENILLEKANQRPWFGWGSWGRGRVYDPDSGRDLSITDGRWVIVLGQFGWVGLLAEFGLLALPVLRCAKALRYLPDQREAIMLAALTLILGVTLLDMLPNNPMSPWTWLLAGALLGRSDQVLINRARVSSASSLSIVGFRSG